MSSVRPGSIDFIAYVYGTVFAARAEAVRRLAVGAPLILVPDPPGVEEPAVWVHAAGGGDLLGHLSPDLNAWLAPAMNGATRCTAVVEHVDHDPTVASWKRLAIRVRCEVRE